MMCRYAPYRRQFDSNKQITNGRFFEKFQVVASWDYNRH